MNRNHENFVKLIEKALPRRYYIFAWSENKEADWWTYRVSCAGQRFAVHLENEEMSEFEVAVAIKEAMKRYGIRLTSIKMTR